MKIQGSSAISRVQLSPELQKAFESQKTTDKADFGDMLNQKIDQVNELQKSADTAVTDFSTGKARNLHEAVLALEMADTSLKMMVTVRNKALEAYQEIMRMQI